MKQNSNLLLISISIVAGVLIIWSVTSIQGGQRTYEVQPQITLPEYRTDAIRTLGAYERLMNRYMDMVDRNLSNIDRDITKTAKQIDSIEVRLIELCERTARIEKALGIEQSKKLATSLSEDQKTVIVNK